MSIQSFQLPNLFSSCPFPLSYHRNGDTIALESDAWYRSGFVNFSREQEIRLETLKASNLMASIYDDADDRRLRAACDLLHLILLYGDFTDDLASQSNQAIADIIANIFKQAYNYSDRPDESYHDAPVLKLSEDFWGRLHDAPRSFKSRFAENMVGFIQARRLQSKHRDTGLVPELETYLQIRRDTSGLKPLIDFLEYTLRIDFPEEVINHPVMQALKDCTNDFTTWSNDLYSYNKEQARSDNYNMVAILMHSEGMDLQDAIDRVGDMCIKVLEEFENLKSQLPSWNPKVDQDIKRYISGLENWFIACLHWSFLSGRYFGKEGPSIRETHVVKLLPKKSHKKPVISTSACTPSHYTLSMASPIPESVSYTSCRA